MTAYTINSPTIIFNHTEYGQRLLFQQGLSNPRDELGKNGVTLHHWFSALFYKTIRIQATLVDEKGVHNDHSFILNRNSLIKYIGKNASATDTDEALINKLDATFCTSDLNQATNAQDRQRQITSGEMGLRHAGQHNQRRINHWRNAVQDFFKGSFFSWLYQNTIAGINQIKIRFLLIGKEKDLFDAGEILAKKRFHEAYKTVPAYRAHIIRFNGQPVAETTLRQLPPTTKDNYIKPQTHDSDTHLHGNYPLIGKTDTSTGTTGKPTAWVRGEKELNTVKKSLQLAAKIQFRNRRLNYINAFAFGPWATGMTTYELMRGTGSVFASGPDKEKILDELLRITKYETHQLELALKNVQTTGNNRLIMQEVIANTLKSILKTPRRSLEEALDDQILACSTPEKNALYPFKKTMLSIAKKLNKEKTQTIITGYPPFLKDLQDFVREKGHSLREFSVIGVVGGQAISEAMRDQLMKGGFNQIYSSYGASDLDINLGVEADDEIFIRKAIENNPGLARELYGTNKGLPMVFHYDPMNYHVECDEEDNLIYTCTREDRSSPRIRYNLGDKGRVYASSDVHALLSKYGIFRKPRANLPLMFVWGRDSTVVFNGANLAFTELERAIMDTDSQETILKKSFYTYEDSHGEHLEIWLELHEGIELPEQTVMDNYAHNLISELAILNQDFRYQLQSLDEGTSLPIVRFFKRHHSPISESGGHRKQVLIFQKGINLDNEYMFPNESVCRGTNLKMSPDLLSTSPRNQPG